MVIDSGKLMEEIKKRSYKITSVHGIQDVGMTVDGIQQWVDEQESLLPCKIGDVVWGIKTTKNGYIAHQGIVSEMFYTKDMDLVVVVGFVCRGLFGKKVFYTKEECDKAIKLNIERENRYV